MRVAALISGGKDSIFNMMHCIAANHELVALGNLHPFEDDKKDDLDSLMFQTVGHQGIKAIAEAVGLPLYRQTTHGISKMQEKHYIRDEDCYKDNDEVLDLYNLIQKLKEDANIEAIATGAIASDYQRSRVEYCCRKLRLVSLAYLWQRDQEELLQEMIDCSVDAILIKVSCMGLDLKHLGKSLREMQPHLLQMKEQFGMNVCGEGGEYETFTLDCPLFSKRVVITESQTVVQSDNDIAPVGYLNLTKVELVDKPGMENVSLMDRVRNFANWQSKFLISELMAPGPVDSDESDSKPISERHLKSLKDVKDQFYPNIPCFNENESGWVRIGLLTSHSKYPSMEKIFHTLRNILRSKQMTFADLVSVSLFIQDMKDFPHLNELYSSAFVDLMPPVRLCVQCHLKENTLLEAVAYKSGSAVKDKNAADLGLSRYCRPLKCGNAVKDESAPNDDLILDRETVLVQCRSNWLPVNVGPYSPVTRIGDFIFLAGQIPLIPETMELLEASISRQCRLTLRHCVRFLKVVDEKLELTDIVQGTCFLADSSYVEKAREEWEKVTKDAVVNYVIVPKLPRGAKLEWSVWAHRKNSLFDYEESREKIGDITISMQRRWNRDNVSVIVGHLSLEEKRDEESKDYFTQEEIVECIEFLLGHLKKGSVAEKPACSLKIFYKVPFSASFIERLLLSFPNQNLVLAFLPALDFHNDETCVSVSGIRHD